MKDKKLINLDNIREQEIIPQRRLSRLMTEICDLAISDLNTLFVEMLNEVDTAFFTLADQAESSQDQSLYFHSMTQLQSRRSDIKAKFSERLAKALIILLNTDLQSPLAQSQFDLKDAEKSRIKNIVNKANSENQAQLWQITSRFDILLSNVSLNLSNNPLSPLSICYIFVETLALLDLQIKAKLSFYDLFEQSLIKNIDLVYKKINALLIRNGVLPNLASISPKKNIVSNDTKSSDTKSNDTKSNDTKSSDTKSSDSMTEFPEKPKADSGANLLEALIILRKENTSLFNEHSLVAVAKVSALEINQLVKALTKIQASREVIDVDLSSPSNKIRKHLENALLASNIESGLLFDQKTEDIIACISMLFDFIDNDNNLPNEFKILISKLQIPLLKVALMETSFLTRGNHPARALLNELAQAGVGWSRGGGVGLKDKAEEVVDKIIKEFDQDITLFTHSLLDFQTFSEQHKKRAFLIERRLQEAELGKARAETATQKANHAIDDIIDGKVLPETIAQLIQEDWQRVMLLTYLRDGEDSEAWNRNIQTAKDLIAALSTTEDITAERVSKQLSDIAQNINLGLDVVDYGEYESAKLFQELQQLFERVHQGEQVISGPSLQVKSSEHMETAASLESEFIQVAHDINYADIPLVIVEEMPATSIEETEQLDAENESFVTRVENLQVGNWFELQLRERVIRCKLAAIITSINKYIFVDYTGKKIAEYSKLNLIQAFKEQQLTQLEEGALFDRAFQSILTKPN